MIESDVAPAGNVLIMNNSLPIVFEDDALKGRAIDAFDPYSRYVAINVEKVPDIKVRQAIGVALDRAALLKNAGGSFAGELADGQVLRELVDVERTE